MTLAQARRRKVIRDRHLYLLLLPVFAYYIIFHFVPMYGAVMAFTEYNIFAGIRGSDWVGFNNFRIMFRNDEFFIVLRNTVMLNVISLLVAFPAPLILALLLNEVRNRKFRRAVQGIVYLPHFLSWVVVSGLIITVLSPSSGLVNNIIRMFGGESIYFMTDSVWWVAIYQLSGVWKEVGWGTIIFLAALSAVDPNLYDAAMIDGASRWDRLKHVTIPGITPMILVVFLLSVGNVMTISFDRPFLLGNPMVLDVADVISTYVYRVGLLNVDYSYAAAVGLFQSVVNFLFLLTANWLSNRIKGEGLF
ncbi:MAG: sugar ABC transporter permease [Spirochaetaceae bacterium]|nr:MAG: sugar ABC transporter permease [Spirochaetaceae bacterium]